jgi:hypothetical protein
MNNPYYQLSPFFSMGTNESPKDKCLPMTNLLVPLRTWNGVKLGHPRPGLGFQNNHGKLHVLLKV